MGHVKEGFKEVFLTIFPVKSVNVCDPCFINGKSTSKSNNKKTRSITLCFVFNKFDMTRLVSHRSGAVGSVPRRTLQGKAH